MKTRRLCICIAVLLLMGHSVSGNLVISLAPAALSLLPNTANQPVDILISTTAGTPSISGFQLNAFIGDGAGGSPEFTFANPAVRFSDNSNYVWGSNSGSPLTDSADAPSVIQSSFVLDSSNIPNPNGRLATLYINTTGFTSGSFPLDWDGGAMASGSLSPSFLTGTNLGTLTLSSAMLSIVPEVSAFVSVAAVGLIVLGCWCVRRWFFDWNPVLP